MKYEYNLKERSEIVYLASKATEEFNAGELINWFEKTIKNKRKLDLMQIKKTIKLLPYWKISL